MNKFSRTSEFFFLVLIFGLSLLLIRLETCFFSSGNIVLTDHDPQEFVRDAFKPAAYVVFGTATIVALLSWIIAASWNDYFQSS